MSNNKDFKVKNGIKPTVYHEGVGTVVSGSSPWSISAISYDNKSFSLAPQDSEPRQIFIKSDGTKLYLAGGTNTTIYQYSLSTAWDISTASYDSVSFGVSGQGASFLRGIDFKSDGTKMFVASGGNTTVYQYSLSTAWDLSTASYDSVSFSTSSQVTSLQNVVFKTDGTKMYANSYNGAGDEVLYQYALSTAWDLSTASYDSKSLTLSADSVYTAFKPDGTKLYTGNFTEEIIEYSLSTAWDVSTGTATGNSGFVSGQLTSLTGFVFKPDDGTKLYAVGQDNDSVYQFSIEQTTASLDLSTGSVFEITPTSDIQISLSNPAASGTVSAATLLLGAADTTGVNSTFSTTLYTGNSSTQTITNGIDLANEGGLVWVKSRSNSSLHALFDTERSSSGNGEYLSTNNTNAAETLYDTDFGGFNSDGFSFNSSVFYGALNYSGNTYASWTFKKQSSFFDIVTYTGNGVAGRTVSHNLSAIPACIIVKRTDVAASWAVYHVGTDATSPEDYHLELDNTNVRDGTGNRWNGTAPTSTEFTVGSAIAVNANNGTYVAYLFAHDTSADGLIQCGSAISGSTVNLGWEPQFIIGRWSNAASNWAILDTERGFTNSTDEVLYANSAGSADNTNDILTPTSTGFTINSSWWGTTNTFIYIAIRSPYVPTITYDPDLQWSGGTAPTAPAIGETDVLTFNTDDGGTTYKAVQSIDGAS